MIKVDIRNGFDVGCFHYEVLSGSEVDKELSEDKQYGICNNIQKQVSITSEFGVDQILHAFTHEIIEAVNYVYCNKEIKHGDIIRISEGLSQVLKSLGIRFTLDGEESK